jgi:hypothetical protein
MVTYIDTDVVETATVRKTQGLIIESEGYGETVVRMQKAQGFDW